MYKHVIYNVVKIFTKHYVTIDSYTVKIFIHKLLLRKFGAWLNN